jgi:hypothetical protein
MQRICRISDAISQLMHLTSEGYFKAARSKVPRRSARAPAAPSVPRARSANAATLALVGAEFEEFLISWKVVDVDWSEGWARWLSGTATWQWPRTSNSTKTK